MSRRCDRVVRARKDDGRRRVLGGVGVERPLVLGPRARLAANDLAAGAGGVVGLAQGDDGEQQNRKIGPCGNVLVTVRPGIQFALGLERGEARKVAASGEPHDTDPLRVDAEFGGACADDLHRALRIHEGGGCFPSISRQAEDQFEHGVAARLQPLRDGGAFLPKLDAEISAAAAHQHRCTVGCRGTIDTHAGRRDVRHCAIARTRPANLFRAGDTTFARRRARPQFDFLQGLLAQGERRGRGCDHGEGGAATQQSAAVDHEGSPIADASCSLCGPVRS